VLSFFRSPKYHPIFINLIWHVAANALTCQICKHFSLRKCKIFHSSMQPQLCTDQLTLSNSRLVPHHEEAIFPCSHNYAQLSWHSQIQDLFLIMRKEYFSYKALMPSLIWKNEWFNIDKSWRLSFWRYFLSNIFWDLAIMRNPYTWSITNAPDFHIVIIKFLY
jgi:hypothetical protein